MIPVTPLRPVELPQARRDLRASLSGDYRGALEHVHVAGSHAHVQTAPDPLGRREPARDPLYDGLIAADSITPLGQELAAAVDHAELLHVSAPMGEVLFGMASQLADLPVGPLDFPAPAGIAYLAGGMPDDEHPAAFLWSVDGDNCLLALAHTWDETGVAQDPATRAVIRATWGCVPHLAVRVVWRGTFTEVADQWESASSDAAMALAAPLLCLFALISERLVATEPPETSRAERRRAEREGHDPGEVKVVTLRLEDRRPTTGAGDSRREYLRMWLVRGHWRDQYLPSTGGHRRTWIAPYVKGSDGGVPMPERETVYAVRR